MQIAIQAAQDVASHIVSDERLGEPRTNRELFDLLVRGGWLSEAEAAPLSNMVGFRNILVHGYGDIDLAVVKDVLENHLEDLLRFAAIVWARIAAADES